MTGFARYLSGYKKTFGIFGLLVTICLITAWQAPDSFLSPENIQNTVRWTALFGIISVGVAFVIITGGIDLSIGSVVGLIGCVLAMCLTTSYTHQDQLEVVSVDQTTKTLTVKEGASDYQSGDHIAFLENFYTIAAVSGKTITLREAPGANDKAGQMLRAHPIVELGPVDKTPIRRGGKRMHSRTVVMDGNQTHLRPDDQIQLAYDVGLPQSFSINSLAFSQGKTTVKFLIRINQRVRQPAFALLSTRSQRMPTPLALALVLMLALLIGLVHGLLVTKLKLQPFIVTLCGLLFYRGVARYITTDQTQGFGSEYPDLKEIAKGDFLEQFTGTEYAFDIPMPFIFLIVLGILAAIFLNKTIYGRYMLALGRNEEAARYSGINTDRMVILSYVICSFGAGVAGILFALDLNSVQPSSHGEFYELYAIAAAVLGGCSLRGGEGSILGVIIAAAVMRVLNNAINLIDGIDTSTEFAIIGMVILIGVVVDELVKRVAAKRRAVRQSREN